MAKTERDVYVCATYYHILIAAIKALRSEQKPDIVLYDVLTTDDLNAVAENIRYSQIFHQVTIFPESKIQYFIGGGRIPNICYGTAQQGQAPDWWLPVEKMPLKRLLADRILTQKAIEEFQMHGFAFQDYRNVYVFNDQMFISAYLRYTKTAYHILEDGLDHYKNVFRYCTFSYDKTLREKILSPLLEIHYVHGKSKYTKSVEVNDAEGIVPIEKKKIRVCPKNQLYAMLSAEEKQRLIHLFTDGYDFAIPPGQDCALILTQPLVEDAALTLNQQMQFYRELIDQHCAGLQVVIKPHPRDVGAEVYRKEFPDAVVMEGKIPMEAIVFQGGLHFKIAVTVTSAALEPIDFADEKIYLGFEWLANQQEKWRKVRL